MEKFADPKFWTDGLTLVIHAPQIVIPLIILVASGVWWLRGHFAKAEGQGLKEQRQAAIDYRQFAEAKADEFSSKLKAAEAKAEGFSRQLKLVQDEVGRLKAQIKASEPQLNVLATANSTSAALSRLQIANTEVQGEIKQLGDTHDQFVSEIERWFMEKYPKKFSGPNP